MGDRPAWWLAVVLIIASALHFLAGQFADPDLWQHLLFGQIILRDGSFPRSDAFSYTAYGAPLVNHEWLAQVFVAGLYGVGGSPALIAFKLLVAAAVVALLVDAVRTLASELAPEGRELPAAALHDRAARRARLAARARRSAAAIVARARSQDLMGARAPAGLARRLGEFARRLPRRPRPARHLRRRGRPACGRAGAMAPRRASAVGARGAARDRRRARVGRGDAHQPERHRAVRVPRAHARRSRRDQRVAAGGTALRRVPALQGPRRRDGDRARGALATAAGVRSRRSGHGLASRVPRAGGARRVPPSAAHGALCGRGGARAGRRRRAAAAGSARSLSRPRTAPGGPRGGRGGSARRRGGAARRLRADDRRARSRHPVRPARLSRGRR